jgi:hypothetical protein
MASKVVRKPGMNLEVWIRDRGEFDPYRVFMDGVMMDLSFEVERHLVIPTDASVVIVQFDGEDGGLSAVFDVAAQPRKLLAKQTTGLHHRYEVVDEA